MQKGYGTFKSIKTKTKEIESIHISTFSLQITKEDSKYVANCVHSCEI